MVAPWPDEPPRLERLRRAVTRKSDGFTDEPRVPAPVALQWQGQKAPNGLAWCCLHPECVRKKGSHGYWGSGKYMKRHLAEHGKSAPAPVLLEVPLSYAGQQCDEDEMWQALNSKKPVYLDCSRFDWSKFNTPVSEHSGWIEGFKGLAVLEEMDEQGLFGVVPADGSPPFRHRGNFRVLRDPLPGEFSAGE